MLYKYNKETLDFERVEVNGENPPNVCVPVTGDDHIV